MRTKLLFDNINASVAATSEIIDFDQQDCRFLVQCLGTGLDGQPRLIIEESIDQTIWSPMEDTATWEDYFPIPNSMHIAIKDNYFMGKYFQVRYEPNDNTTGTIKLLIGYKTKP